jgi:CheY-like chemotaxis protein
MEFKLGKSVPFEESLTCEFKEIRGKNPVKQISKIVDEYVVAFLNEKGGSIYWGIDDKRTVQGVRINHEKRDLLKQIVGQKISSIAPPIPKNSHDMPFHSVRDDQNQKPEDDEVYIIELKVLSPEDNKLYLTESGEAFRKTVGGKKKLTGAELLTALLNQLDQKEKEQTNTSTSITPSIDRRLQFIKPLITGSNILWIDDNPNFNIYERTTLRKLNIQVDTVSSSTEALYMMENLEFDLIVSDISRESDPLAGLRFLKTLQRRENTTPLIFYIGNLDPNKPTPIGAFAITNRPGEFFHYIFDVLER